MWYLLQYVCVDLVTVLTCFQKSSRHVISVCFLVLVMPSERYVTTKKLFSKTISNLFAILFPVKENNTRHVDDNELTLTKEQSYKRIIILLIVSSTCLSFVVGYLIYLSCYQNNPREGDYFHENINEKLEPMRNQKLVLIHIDGTTKKLGL